MILARADLPVKIAFAIMGDMIIVNNLTIEEVLSSDGGTIREIYKELCSKQPKKGDYPELSFQLIDLQEVVGRR